MLQKRKSIKSLDKRKLELMTAWVRWLEKKIGKMEKKLVNSKKRGGK